MKRLLFNRVSSPVRVAHTTRDGHSYFVLFTPEREQELRFVLAAQRAAGELPMKVLCDLGTAMQKANVQARRDSRRK